MSEVISHYFTVYVQSEAKLIELNQKFGDWVYNEQSTFASKIAYIMQYATLCIWKNGLLATKSLAS